MAKKLSTGDTVDIKNRLYGVVDAKGKFVPDSWADALAIYPTRLQARKACQSDFGERVIRLADVSGTIV